MNNVGWTHAHEHTFDCSSGPRLLPAPAAGQQADREVQVYSFIVVVLVYREYYVITSQCAVFIIAVSGINRI